MHVFNEYKLSHPRTAIHYRMAFSMGLIALILAALLLTTRGWPGAPGLWSALGLAVATLLMLWSVRAAHAPRAPVSERTRRWVAVSDAWYPVFLVTMQNAAVAIILFQIWFTLVDLGFPAGLLQHILLSVILFCISLRRALQARRVVNGLPLSTVADDFLGYFSISLITLMLARSAYLGLVPEDAQLRREVPAAAVVIWILASLLILSCIVLFIDHTLRRRGERSDVAPDDDVRV